MKILVLSLMAALPAFVSAAELSELPGYILRFDSTGKLVSYREDQGKFTLADGGKVYVYDYKKEPCAATEVANTVCDLTKNWQVSSGEIFCIAK